MEAKKMDNEIDTQAAVSPREKTRAELVSEYDQELRADGRMPRNVRRQLVRDFGKELAKRGVR